MKRRKAEPGGISELTLNDLQVQLVACFSSVLRITPVLLGSVLATYIVQLVRTVIGVGVPLRVRPKCEFP